MYGEHKKLFLLAPVEGAVPTVISGDPRAVCGPEPHLKAAVLRSEGDTTDGSDLTHLSCNTSAELVSSLLSSLFMSVTAELQVSAGCCRHHLQLLPSEMPM